MPSRDQPCLPSLRSSAIRIHRKSLLQRHRLEWIRPDKRPAQTARASLRSSRRGLGAGTPNLILSASIATGFAAAGNAHLTRPQPPHLPARPSIQTQYPRSQRVNPAEPSGDVATIAPVQHTAPSADAHP